MSKQTGRIPDNELNAEPPTQTPHQIYSECLSNPLSRHLSLGRKQRARMRNAKSLMAEALRNTSCDDNGLMMNFDIKHPDNITESQWLAPPPPEATVDVGMGIARDDESVGAGSKKRKHKKPKRVRKLFDRDGARIYVIDNFTLNEECSVMMDVARPYLRRATVNEGGDNQAISSARQAQAANIVPSAPGDVISTVRQRVLDFANAYSDYNLSLAGQEPLSVVQYTRGQEYRSHCDGGCDGSPFLTGGRVATMIMYCQISSHESGGGTTFGKAGIHIQPNRNQAVFFSYRGSDNYMEPGFTEQSGCPVKKGQKWVVTQWFRGEVNAETTWVHYDPQGNRITASRF